MTHNQYPCRDCPEPSHRTIRRTGVWRLPVGWARSALLVVVAWGCAGIAEAQSVTSIIDREYTIKAAFLYHFSTYVEWPPNAFPASDQPFVIGVYQTNPFGSSLDQIAKTKKVTDRSIAIRKLTSVDGLQTCHILFVPASVSAAQQDAILGATQGSLVLVVGETDDFIQRGGDAQFFVEGNKVRFAFSAEVAKRSDLKVSSKLLSLAKIIPRQ